VVYNVHPNGESFREMLDRSVSYFGLLASAHTDDSILLLVHAGVIPGLICHFLELD
jgi:broad specificity phosphatase PhoE